MRCQGCRAHVAAVVLACAGGAASADVTSLYQTAFESTAFPGHWSNRTVTRTGVFSQFLGRFGDESVTLTLGAIQPPPGKNGGGAGGGGGPDGGGDNGGGGDGGGGGGGGGGGDGGDGSGYSPGGSASPSNPVPGFGARNNDPQVHYQLVFDLYLIDSWDWDSHGPDTFSVMINGETYFDEVLSNHSSAHNFRNPDVGPAGLGFADWNDSIFRNIEIWFDVDPSDEQLLITFMGGTDQDIEDESWGIDNVRVGYVITPSPGAGGLLACGAVVMASRRRREKRGPETTRV
ncbi:MAG: hypothetical protein R3B57_02620 [Phycisphaerales bacterium]